MPTVVVTGANRSLGLEFCRQYAAERWSVIATCRAPAQASALEGLGVEVFPLDTSDVAQADALAATLAGRPVDLLLNNAGVMGDKTKSAFDADLDAWQTAFRINALGPAIVTRALLPNLQLTEAPVAATMGSQAGIYDRMQSAELAIYRSTKAAAHAVTISLAHALKDRGVIYLSLRPGRTKTDMTGPDADYEAEDSVRLMRSVLANVKPEWAGKFVDRSGVVYPYGGGFQGYSSV